MKVKDASRSPAHPEDEEPSARCMRELVSLANGLLAKVQLYDNIIRVGRVELVGDVDFHIRLPGDHTPQESLRDVEQLLAAAQRLVGLARDARETTLAAAARFGDPEGRCAERCDRLEVLADCLEGALRMRPVINPRTIRDIHRLVATRFDPRIAVTVTKVYWI